MDFVDKTVVALAGESTRGALFDQDALERLVEAAYDTTDMGIEGPFSPDFGDFRMGWAPGPLGTLEGTWNVVGAAERTEARFRMLGLSADGLPRVDALWRGRITARYRRGGEPITAVATRTPDDRTIAATITFDAPAPVELAARPLAVAVALLVRAELQPAALLHEVGIVRERLAALGVERPPDDGLRPRRPLVAGLVVPEAVFDDDDWPGAAPGMSPPEQRAARGVVAGRWLAREGIGLVIAG
jgi:hypothetical protein